MDKHNSIFHPPPYNTADYSPDEAEELLQRLTVATELELSTGGCDTGIEVRRVRGFMLFALSVDYQCDTTATLSGSDRQHFAFVENRLYDLHSASRSTQCTSAERQSLASYFWHHLQAPSKSLGIPVEYVVMTIMRFSKFSDYNGQYKGCLYGILHDHGLEALAHKLNMDRLIVLHKLLPKGENNNDQLRLDYAVRMHGFSRLYFEQFPTMDAMTVATNEVKGPGSNDWDNIQNMHYVATERGRAYQIQRRGASVASGALSALNPAHWQERVEAVTDEIKRRHRQVCRLMRWPDGLGSWRGVHDLIPRGTNPRSHLWHRPFAWRKKQTLYLPEMYEHRPFQGGCEV